MARQGLVTLLLNMRNIDSSDICQMMVTPINAVRRYVAVFFFWQFITITTTTTTLTISIFLQFFKLLGTKQFYCMRHGPSRHKKFLINSRRWNKSGMQNIET